MEETIPDSIFDDTDIRRESAISGAPTLVTEETLQKIAEEDPVAKMY